MIQWLRCYHISSPKSKAVLILCYNLSSLASYIGNKYIGNKYIGNKYIGNKYIGNKSPKRPI